MCGTAGPAATFVVVFGKCQQPYLLNIVARQSDEILTVRSVSVVVINNQIDGHFPLQTVDVSMTEVIAELVNLRNQ